MSAVSCSAPEGVEAPAADEIGATYIVLAWAAPSSPNGVLTGFTVYLSPTTALYSGALTSFNVTNLSVC